MNYDILEWDLLESPCKFIVHQCNATHNRPKGLSHSMFSRFPYANIYLSRGEFKG